MKKITFFIAALLIPILLVSSGFYKNLAEEGKKLYLSGNYVEAIRNFRIAEFGLMTDKALLTDIYFYYSLANFKLSNGDAVIELTEKLKSVTGKSRFDEMSLPEEIRTDLERMFSVLDETYKKMPPQGKIPEKTGDGPEKPVNTSEEFVNTYNGIRDSLKKDDLDAVKSGLMNLERIDKNDPRTAFISGIISFRESRYEKAVRELIHVNKVSSGDIQDESSYYLALANYFLRNYGLFMAYYQKISDPAVKNKLSEISGKVAAIRQEGLDGIRIKFFNKKGFKKFALSFNGDISLASDILNTSLRIVPVRSMDIYYLADAVIAIPDIYDRNFIVSAADLFLEKEMGEYAVDIVKRSKFLKDKTEEDIEVYYKLGTIYDELGDKKKAKNMMLKVYNMDRNYKQVNYYLTK